MTTVKYTMRVLDKTGHTELDWNPADAAETAAVKEKFDEMVGGLKSLAYTRPTDGSMGEAIREFNPEVSIDITPQMQGG